MANNVLLYQEKLKLKKRIKEEKLMVLLEIPSKTFSVKIYL